MKYIKQGIYLLTFGILFAFLESFRENHKIKVTRMHVQSAKIPKQKKSLRVIFISDYHNLLKGKTIPSILQKVEEEHPDLVLLGGDMLVGNNRSSFAPAIQLIRSLNERFPVYMAEGNHEKRLRERPEVYGNRYEKFRQALPSDVHYLRNENALIKLGDSPIRIYGLDMDYKYFKRGKMPNMSTEYLQEVLGQANEDEFNILLAHNPEYFPTYAAWGADLSLCGHFHGGIMILPKLGGFISPRLHLFPKYYAGRYEEADRTMILTTGLGVHSLPIRLFNYPEIVSFTIDGCQD